MNHHRFILQPYKTKASRFYCPQCQDSRRTFKRYIDLETNAYLADHVGRCDRQDNCGYHYTPRQYFADNPYDLLVRPIKVCNAMPVKDLFNHLPSSLVKESMVQKAYIHNNFMIFLAAVYGWKTALHTAERYKIGTSKHWHGATVFWQVDSKGRTRTGKIMLYDYTTGKRVKQPFNHVAWVHNLVSKSGSRRRVGESAGESASRRVRESESNGSTGLITNAGNQLPGAPTPGLPDSRTPGLPDSRTINYSNAFLANTCCGKTKKQ